MSILQFRSIYHVAENFEDSLNFYKDGLGFPMKFRDENRWAEFRVGEARFALSSPGEASGTNARTVAVFQTADQKQLEKRVETFGGTILQWRDMGSHGRVGTIQDPSGTIFQVLLFEQNSGN